MSGKPEMLAGNDSGVGHTQPGDQHQLAEQTGDQQPVVARPAEGETPPEHRSLMAAMAEVVGLVEAGGSLRNTVEAEADLRSIIEVEAEFRGLVSAIDDIRELRQGGAERGCYRGWGRCW